MQGALSKQKNPAQSGAVREGFLEEMPLGGVLEAEHELARRGRRSWHEEGPECVQNVCAMPKGGCLLEDRKGRCEGWDPWGPVKQRRHGRGHMVKTESHSSRLFTSEKEKEGRESGGPSEPTS